ncbi:hypothetical protein ACFS6H_07815 [Terrimonas rubra]|uniref:DUF4848 domain-containing protein n=1 Tax=Terrimonas rubra TaxID=1035890 RepID=A0ABW6A4U1_9BACT
MKPVITGIFTTLLLLTFVSCKKSNLEQQTNLDNEIKVENNRLVFSSQEAFQKTVDALFDGKLDKSVLPNNKSFLSLEKAFSAINWENESATDASLIDLYNAGLPLAHQQLLNAKGEVKIGANIVWYNKNQKYYIPASQENEIAHLKANPALIEKKARFGKTISLSNEADEQLSGTLTTDLPISGALHSPHQMEFYKTSDLSKKRKYVHELAVFYEDFVGGPYWKTYLTLRIKLEYRGGGSWNSSPGEVRFMQWNLQGTASVSNGIYTGTYELPQFVNYSGSVTQAGDYSVPLGRYLGSGTKVPGAKWVINISGSMYHRIVGDADANIYSHSGNPLW